MWGCYRIWLSFYPWYNTTSVRLLRSPLGKLRQPNCSRHSLATFTTKLSSISPKTTPALFRSSLVTTSLLNTGLLRGKLTTSHTIRPFEPGSRTNFLLSNRMPLERQHSRYLSAYLGFSDWRQSCRILEGCEANHIYIDLRFRTSLVPRCQSDSQRAFQKLGGFVYARAWGQEHFSWMIMNRN